MNGVGGLREQKKARMRQQLAQAAQALFRSQGFEQTTIDEIAASAEVSRRTFFRYFKSKESVVFPDFERRLDDFHAKLSEGEDASVFQTLSRALQMIAEDYVANREEMMRQYEIVRSSSSLTAYEIEIDRRWEEAIADFLRDRMQARTAAERRMAEVLSGATFGAARAMLRNWFEGAAQEDLTAMSAQAISLLETGFGSLD